MLTEIREARIIGDGFLRRRTERVLRELYGFTACDRGEWTLPAGAWPGQQPRVPPGALQFFGAGGSTYGAGPRRVRVPELDVLYDPAPRIMQVVTTFHRGGAERIAMTLGGPIIALDTPRRSTWPLPPQAIQATGRTRQARLEMAVRQALAHGADLISAHLLDREELKAFSSRGFPIVCTVHNAREAWPDGLTDAPVDLYIACAKHVAESLACPGNVRTIWNGITPAPSVRPLRLRGRLKLAVVANARQQKRFDRLPDLLALVPDAHAYVAGDGAPFSHPRLHWLGTLEEPARLYRAADVFVSMSDYEGMSLAELEALQHGLPLVLWECPAHRELAAMHPGVRVAGDLFAFAKAISEAKCATGGRGSLAPDFHADTMRARYRAQYRQILRRRTPKHDVVLVTNNFALGGAQSSGRRLLHALTARGLHVAAVTLQEHPAHPSEGLATLGVECFVAPPGPVDAAIEAVLDWLACERLLFWNVIPEHKMLLADLWRDGPVFDVSPGEMYFASLARYFARPRIGHPIRNAREYGALLAGMFVKYGREARRAEETLGLVPHVISNGVDLPLHWPRPAGGPFVIGTLARLSPDKKLEQLLAAFAHVKRRLPDARLLIGGAHETGSEAYAAKLRANHPHVEWLGAVRADVSFFSRLHAFALVAEPEGCPNASLEAMAHGVPVVGTNAGGAAEQIVDGETGFLVPRGDSVALAERLLDLSGTPVLAAQFSRAARHRCEAHFSLEAMAAAYWQVLSGQSQPAAAMTA